MVFWETKNVHLLARAGDASGEASQEMWLVSANAGLGTARDLAADRRHASLRLDPTAAVALRYASDKTLEVFPDALGGAPLPGEPWWIRGVRHGFPVDVFGIQPLLSQL